MGAQGCCWPVSNQACGVYLQGVAPSRPSCTGLVVSEWVWLGLLLFLQQHDRRRNSARF